MTKLALLIGINYFDSKYALNGCINDVTNIKNFLEDKLDFNNFVIMTDKNPDKKRDTYPSAINIIKQLKNIVQQANNNGYNEIWISYSGHGYFVPDKNGDEYDRKDECLVPLTGYITDDLFYDIISDLNDSIKCVCLFDCCHSGTFADLPYDYLCDIKGKFVKKKYRLTEKYHNSKRKKCPAKVITINGCRDNQTSNDYYDPDYLSWQGALTSSVIENFNQDKDISIHQLLLNTNGKMKELGFKQKPVISCSQKIDYKDKFLFS